MLVLTSRDVWATTLYWLCEGVPYAVVGHWYEVTPLVLGWGLAKSTSGRSRWCEETRLDPDWHPQGWKRRITQV